MLMLAKLKASLTALTICSLAGCASPVVSHVPVGCLGLPVVKVQFTGEEADAIPMSAIEKIVTMRETYKTRINAQCEINTEHDKLFGGDN